MSSTNYMENLYTELMANWQQKPPNLANCRTVLEKLKVGIHVYFHVGLQFNTGSLSLHLFPLGRIDWSYQITVSAHQRSCELQGE